MGHHRVAHFKTNIDLVELPPEPLRLTVDQRDVNNLAFFIRGQLSVAYYHGNQIRIRELENQLKLLGEWRPS